MDVDVSRLPRPGGAVGSSSGISGPLAALGRSFSSPSANKRRGSVSVASSSSATLSSLASGGAMMSASASSAALSDGGGCGDPTPSAASPGAAAATPTAAAAAAAGAGASPPGSPLQLPTSPVSTPGASLSTAGAGGADWVVGVNDDDACGAGSEPAAIAVGGGGGYPHDVTAAAAAPDASPAAGAVTVAVPAPTTPPATAAAATAADAGAAAVPPSIAARAAPRTNPLALRVAMVATKAPSEPPAMLQATLSAMLAQEWPVRFDVWLADEDTPVPEMAAWCEAHGVRVSCRKGVEGYHNKEWPRRRRCKEGNLAYFYDTHAHGAYDVVCQFDADHVPRADYLKHVVPCFADATVGYVACPSICGANADVSWAVRGRLCESSVAAPVGRESALRGQRWWMLWRALHSALPW